MAKITIVNEEGQNLNRYKMVPVDGQANTYDLERAANITKQGTPFSPETMAHYTQDEDLAAHTSDADIHVTAEKKAAWDSGIVSTYIHTKAGTVHDLDGTGNNIEFLAKADISDGDTWTVNGVVVTATLQNGDPLPADLFKSGSWVTGVRLDGAKLGFKSAGGGVKLNVFCQPTLPTDVFDGICILTPAKQSVKKIVNKPSFVIGGSWAADGTVPPLTNGAYGDIVFDSLYYNGKIYYLCRSNVSSSSATSIRIYEYDIATKTYTSYGTVGSVNGNSTNHWTIAGLFMAVSNNTIKVYVYGQENASYIGKYWVYHTDTHVVDASVAITTLTSTPSDNMSSFGQDLDNLYFGAVFYNFGFTIFKLNLTTSTTTVLYHNTDSAGSSYTWQTNGILYNNKIYFLDAVTYPNGYTYTFKIYDITLNQVVTKTSPTAMSFYSNQRTFAAFQNTIYITSASATTFVKYDVATGTFSTFALPSTITFVNHYLTTTNNALYTTVGSSANPFRVDCYNFVSETLDANTLAILDGSGFSAKIITTTLINFIKTLFSNIWWYDTDFKEYPTYIGNGTAWVKIKN